LPRKHVKVTLGDCNLRWFLAIHQGSSLACAEKKVLQGVMDVAEHVLLWLVGIPLTRNFHALV
jgi:hypothetical protein